MKITESRHHQLVNEANADVLRKISKMPGVEIPELAGEWTPARHYEWARKVELDDGTLALIDVHHLGHVGIITKKLIPTVVKLTEWKDGKFHSADTFSIANQGVVLAHTNIGRDEFGAEVETRDNSLERLYKYKEALSSDETFTNGMYFDAQYRLIDAFNRHEQKIKSEEAKHSWER